MISGFATSSGTKNFLDKHVDIKFSYKNFQGLTLSNIGIGTYLGDADEQTDIIVKNAVKESILSGVNVIDTAINYRAQKAERSVGNAISELISEEKARSMKPKAMLVLPWYFKEEIVKREKEEHRK